MPSGWSAMGYSVLVADLFGTPLHAGDRASEAVRRRWARCAATAPALRDRLLAVLDAGPRAATQVDADRIAAIGFCFGGQCALDLARSGADIAGVASFHGLFDPPGLPPQPIKAKVAAYHGWDDPMVPPDAVVALGKELTAAGCDWQIHAYGHVGHGFTNPGAAECDRRASALTRRRRGALGGVRRFLAECFE